MVITILRSLENNFDETKVHSNMSTLISLRDACDLGEYTIIEECIPLLYRDGIENDKINEYCPLFETCLYEANHHFERHQEIKDDHSNHDHGDHHMTHDNHNDELDAKSIGAGIGIGLAIALVLGLIYLLYRKGTSKSGTILKCVYR